jgi:hypothetical protein
MNRRELLRLLAALPPAGAACAREERPTMTKPSEPPKSPAGGRMPVVFAAHGAPMLRDDEVWVKELAA